MIVEGVVSALLPLEDESMPTLLGRDAVIITRSSGESVVVIGLTAAEIRTVGMHFACPVEMRIEQR